MTRTHSEGAIGILRRMSESELYLQGDPSGLVPLFLLPLRPWRRVKLRVAKPIEATAQHCAELLDDGLIEPITTGVQSGDRRFQISKKGYRALNGDENIC
jgi:hypothetical protein